MSDATEKRTINKLRIADVARITVILMTKKEEYQKRFNGGLKLKDAAAELKCTPPTLKAALEVVGIQWDVDLQSKLDFNDYNRQVIALTAVVKRLATKNSDMAHELDEFLTPLLPTPATAPVPPLAFPVA